MLWGIPIKYYTVMRILQAKKVKDGHEVWKYFQKIQIFLRNFHLLQFCHQLPQSSQSGSTFDGFDYFHPLAENDSN